MLRRPGPTALRPAVVACMSASYNEISPIIVAAPGIASSIGGETRPKRGYLVSSCSRATVMRISQPEITKLACYARREYK